MNTSPGPPRDLSLRQWRVSTAVRVFALALAVGGVLASQSAGHATPLLAALTLIAGVASALEWGTPTARTRWLPVVEGLLVALLLMTASEQPEALAYLAVPPIVAGVRFGILPASNATLVAAAASVATIMSSADPHDTERLARGAVWLMAGYGAALLASWLLRSVRDIEARQAPYATANLLMSQLHDLAQDGTLGLDSSQLAADLTAALHTATDADSAVERAAAQGIADDLRLRLDTARLFDDVRLIATAEERNRLACEMHDGVAQEIVALGYIVDEIECLSGESTTRALASTLRDEISRVVTELRFSIFDLRHHVVEHRLSAALSDYAREASTGTTLCVHLLLDEACPALTSRTESELLRIAQEAIANVRKHADATNLWVALASDASGVTLRIEDDGIGNAAPRERHWGIQTMTERAARIGARLTVTPRTGGGTVVLLSSADVSAIERTTTHAPHSPAH